MSRRIITPLSLQLGNKTPGTNILSVSLDPGKLLAGEINPTLPADGTSVAKWWGLAGNGNNADQAVALNQPKFKTNIANGKPMVLFDGADSQLVVASSDSTTDVFLAGGVFIMVIKPTTIGENSAGRLYSLSGGNHYVDLTATAGSTCKIGLHQGFSITAGDWITTGTPINLAQTNIVAMSYNCGSVSNDPIFYINSLTPATITESVTPVGTASAVNTLTIGNATIANKSFDGYFGKIDFFKGVLSQAQIANLITERSLEYKVTLV